MAYLSPREIIFSSCVWQWQIPLPREKMNKQSNNERERDRVIYYFTRTAWSFGIDDLDANSMTKVTIVGECQKRRNKARKQPTNQLSSICSWDLINDHILLASDFFLREKARAQWMPLIYKCMLRSKRELLSLLTLGVKGLSTIHFIMSAVNPLNLHTHSLTRDVPTQGFTPVFETFFLSYFHVIEI